MTRYLSTSFSVIQGCADSEIIFGGQRKTRPTTENGSVTMAAAEGSYDSTNVFLAKGGGTSHMMKFVSIVVSMVASAASSIIGVHCFINMSWQPLSKPLNSLVKYKVNNNYNK